MSVILAIDPGTKTGWALTQPRMEPLSGTWDLSPRRGDGAGMRFLRLHSKLDEIHGMFFLTRLVYELPVGQYKSGAADDLIKGMVSHIQSWAESASVPYEGVAPSQLKKFATGKGNANKDVMFALAKERWPNVSDHNEADARFLLQMVLDGRL